MRTPPLSSAFGCSKHLDYLRQLPIACLLVFYAMPRHEAYQASINAISYPKCCNCRLLFSWIWKERKSKKGKSRTSGTSNNSTMAETTYHFVFVLTLASQQHLCTGLYHRHHVLHMICLCPPLQCPQAQPRLRWGDATYWVSIELSQYDERQFRHKETAALGFGGVRTKCAWFLVKGYKVPRDTKYREIP